MARLRELWRTRETLVNLVRKELKVKYTASVLGAVWSLLNPVVFMAVFSFVVAVLGRPIQDFPVFLLSGLLAWNLFSNSLNTGARAVIDNANLVKKIAFPREILPLSAVGVAVVDFVLQSLVLLGFIVVVRPEGPSVESLVLYPLALLSVLAFTTAMAFLASAINVRYRDTQHLLSIGLLVWFWLTPIVYAASRVHEHLSGTMWTLYLVNPMAPVILTFQRALYGRDVLPRATFAWFLAIIGVTLVASSVLLFASWRLFFRMSGDFAEEL